MSESVPNGESKNIVEYLHDKRENFKKEFLNVDLLTSQAGSQDLTVAQEAKEQLRKKWDLDPEKDAKNAKTIDLMEQLGKFTEDERINMATQLVGLQLTEGCNGNCPFCLFGKKKGVDSKYSFDSVDTYLRKYADYIPGNLFLYWDSDPFDYRDGDRNFTDIYKTLRDIRPMESQFISTAIPRGGEEDFIHFMKNAALEQKGKNKKEISLKMRVSLAEHNLQRVETTIIKLTDSLFEEGYTQQEIDDFYFNCLKIDERFESVYKIGPLIKDHDDIKDIETSACRDGVLISPKSSKAIMVTVPTVYEPSGEKNIPILPGQSELQIPLYKRIEDYTGFHSYDSLVARTKYRRTMMDIIRTPNNSEYKLPDKVEDIVLKLGRETASIGKLIIDIADLPTAPKTIEKNLLDKQNYLSVATVVFRERQLQTQEQINIAKEMVINDSLLAVENDKIQFYILLTETYLAEMDFLADQIEESQPVETVSSIATLFRQVGREQVSELPEIIKKLTEISK